MRLFILLVLLSGGYTQHDIQLCDEIIRGEILEYVCEIHNANISLEFKPNDYAYVVCDGTDFNCEDIPGFDFTSNIPLNSLGVFRCPPNILRCVNDIFLTPQFKFITLRDIKGPLKEEDVENLIGVEQLMIRQADAESTIPSKALHVLPTLKQLRITESNIQLSPNVFKRAPQLEYLELASQLTSIPEGSFNGLRNLTELSLWFNQFEGIEAGAFNGLDNLKNLSLSTNFKLKSLPPLSNLSKLERLTIMNNALETLDNGVLERLHQLQHITIQFNRANLTLESHAMSNLQSLKNVVIHWSNVLNLPETLFVDSNNIQEIKIIDNWIEILPRKVFWNQTSLKILDLSGNKIKALPSDVFAYLKQVEYINLSKNNIQYLPSNLFSGQKELKVVNLDNNKISMIALGAFRGVPTDTLSLMSNQLTFDSYNEMSPFQSLTKLKNLNLKDNKISTFYDDWKYELNQLKYLDLSSNMFLYAPTPRGFVNPDVTIDLRNNHISQISLDPRVRFTNITHSQTRKPRLLLEGNPFNCDCELYGLWLRTQEVYTNDDEITYVLDNAKCSSPNNLNGNITKNLSPSQFICEVPIEISNCTSVVSQISTNELVIDCHEMPLILPNVTTINYLEYFTDIPTVTVKLNQQPESIDAYNIHTLILSNTSLKSINFNPSDSLKVLDVSSNNISSISKQFLDKNVSLYLADNPLDCSCWYFYEISRLKRYEYLIDIDNVTCANGDFIKELDVNILCNTLIAVVSGILTFIALIIIIIIVSLTVYKYWYEILVIMSKGYCKGFVTQTLLDAHKEYDLFISFSHKDFEKIDSILLPTLINEYKQKVCVHHIDWLVGESIPSQIQSSVLNSRKTIIFLSSHFLDSGWANLEFLTAYNLTIKERTSRVIIILTDEKLVDDSRLSKELRAFLKTNTYLLWSEDSIFWKKLEKVLPRITYSLSCFDAIRRWGRKNTKIVECEENKNVKSALDVQLNSNNELVNVAVKNV